MEESRLKDEIIMSGLLQYFLTLSIQVPLAFRDYEMVLYLSWCLQSVLHHYVLWIVLWPHCKFCTFGNSYFPIRLLPHSYTSATLFLWALYTTNSNVRILYYISTVSQMAKIDSDRTDCVSWTVFHWVMCRECCINRCDIIGLSIVFCCTGLCVC